MYLSHLSIKNYRKLDNFECTFVKGLNVILGPNNIGKTALIDALRLLFSNHDDSPYLRVSEEDISKNDNNNEISIIYTFSGLNIDDEAKFLPALVNKNGKYEVQIGITARPVGNQGRMRVRRWCAQDENQSLSSDMLEELRTVYLKPLRDVSKGLKPNKYSQLAKLLRLLVNDKEDKKRIEEIITSFETKLNNDPAISSTKKAITSNHGEMLGDQLSQNLELNIAGTSFEYLSSTLSLTTDGFDVDSNGLGYNNLIYMAVVLSEMIKDPNSAYRALIIEEPEAHLHPQLQVILLDYLENYLKTEQEGSIQLFVTSHSANFASLANIDSLTCLLENENTVTSFSPRDTNFDVKPKKSQVIKSKLQRFLDINRSELFFARRIIFVEGSAEKLLLSTFADCLGEDYNLKKRGISIISVDGLNFNCFLPLFCEDLFSIPVAVITDADPPSLTDIKDNNKIYPNKGEKHTISSTTKGLKIMENKYIKVFHGTKTLEYDLALEEPNQRYLVESFKELHPKLGNELSLQLPSSTNKARDIYTAMFDRDGKNVQKGAFAQELCSQIQDNKSGFIVPEYIKEAINYVCK